MSSSSSNRSRRDPAEDDGNDGGEKSLIETLRERILNYFEGVGEREPRQNAVSLSDHQAMHLLEASNGDIDLAAGYFLDEYFATTTNSDRLKQEDQPQLQPDPASSSSDPSAAGGASRSHAGAKRDEADNNAKDNRNKPDSVRRVRRRLEDRFRDVQNNRDNDDENEDDDDEEDDGDQHEPGGARPAAAAAAAAANQNEPHQPVQNRNRLVALDEVAAAAAALRGNEDEAQVVQGRNQPVPGSVSVSDDEGAGGVWRLSSRRRRYENNNNNDAAEDIGMQAEVGRNRLSRYVSDRYDLQNANSHAKPDTAISRNEGMLDTEGFNDSYISDDDWVFKSSASSPSYQLPTGLLWGESNNSSSNQNRQDGPNNVVDDEEDQESAKGVCCMPSTWTRVGFTVSSCARGLVVRPPSGEAITLYRWQQQQARGGSDSRNLILPPYHCMSVTCVLSIVTAMLYSGASVQGKTVNCSSARTPYAELAEEQKRHQFNSRLADALTALLFIAVKAATARKKKAVEIRQGCKEHRRTDDQGVLQKQNLSRKLRLCPTCRWETDHSSNEAGLPEGRDLKTIRITTSYTAIKDLRDYVVSNIKSFTSPGGVALLLETIVRIHGKGTLTRLIRNCRKVSGIKLDKDMSLVKCQCEARMVRPPKSVKTPNNKPILDTTPPGHDCLSTEMISLLLTGQVHSTFKGWTTEELGFGILSNDIGLIGKELMNVTKPIWILRGETCYTVAFIDPKSTIPADLRNFDTPNTVFEMQHWSSWYGKRRNSSFRVIIARPAWNPPKLSKPGAVPHNWETSVMEKILADRKRKFASSVGDTEAAVPRITKEEIDAVESHPDDQKYYHDNYRLWRFKVTQASDWTPFHRLKEKDKHAAEMKCAPKINHVLWSKWKGATIQNFTPSNGPHPVV